MKVDDNKRKIENNYYKRTEKKKLSITVFLISLIDSKLTRDSTLKVVKMSIFLLLLN